MKRPADAITKLEEVLAIRRKALGEDSMPVARTMFNLGQVYTSTKQLDKADRTLPEAVARLERALGAKHPDLVIALRGVSTLREAQGRWPEAVTLTRRSLALALETNGPDHADTAASYHRLGRLLRDEKQYAEAEPHLLRASAIREKVLGADARPTHESIEALIRLYEAWGKPDAAKALAASKSK
jgi:tetratricopeptide (TPR) repeat protein